VPDEKNPILEYDGIDSNVDASSKLREKREEGERKGKRNEVIRERGSAPKWLLSAVAASVSFLPFLGRDDRWSSHEALHAEVARELTVSGDWLVPRLNGRVYCDKPPLLHWLIALSYHITGRVDMLAARLPSAVAAISGALAVYGIGLLLLTPRAALLASLVTAGTPIYAMMARTARPDMLLCALVLLASLACARAGRLRGSDGARRLLCFLFGGSAGLATLVKGPLGLAMPLLFLFIFLWRERSSPLRDAPSILLGVAGFAVAVAAWVAPLLLRPEGAAYLWRVASQPDLMTLNEKHARPFYYYLGPFPAGFAPFLPFLALGVLDVVSRKARAGSALWMTALLFLLFSAITGKRWHYLLPLCPFAALVVGEAMDRRWNRGSFWRWASSVVIASSILGFPIFYGSLAPYFLGPNLARLAALRVNELVPRSARLICMSSLTDEVDFLGQRTVEEVWSVDELGPRLKGPQPETYLLVLASLRDEVEKAMGKSSLSLLYEDTALDRNGNLPPADERQVLYRFSSQVFH